MADVPQAPVLLLINPGRDSGRARKCAAKALVTTAKTKRPGSFRCRALTESRIPNPESRDPDS